MSLPSIMISGFKSGVQKNKKPFLLVDDAFSTLENGYVYREEVRNREGQKFIGRYRRLLTAQTLSDTTPAADGFSIVNIFTSLGITGESDAQIQPGSLVITIAAPDTSTFTDQGDGTFVVTGLGLAAGSFVNYATGAITLEFTGVLTGGAVITANINYYPTLPSMGICEREIVGINDEQTIWFDTKYAYIHDGSNFQELPSTTPVTWNGTDSDFFWYANYRGSDPGDRLFFATNFVDDGGSPMRYYNGTTWTDFSPIISGTSQSDTLTTALAFGSANYASNLTAVPLIKGTVVITVSINGGGETDVIFRDTPKDGTLVSSGSNTGTIDYITGAISLTFSPVLPGAAAWTVKAVYSVSSQLLLQAQIIVPYYGRLVALNTIEGTTLGTGTNIFNRARFSQIGNPIQQDAWRADVFGKGGFIDAPTNERIISARFFKKVLIVQFEQTTWRLQYLGEYGLPFIWERISSDFGSESTFSTVLFDDGVLAVGDKAIVSSSGNDVQRIDLEIPDTVYSFKNADNGVKRVHGIRDFKKELVYWCYPDYKIQNANQVYPTRTLVYNYRNGTFAFFRNNVTCFGTFQYPAGITWDRYDVFWDDYSVLWDSVVQEKYPVIVSGNQQGFAHFYGSPDAETLSESSIPTNDQESLSVYAVTVVSGVDTQLTIPNHNLITGDFIYLTGLQYLVLASSTTGSTTLNDFIYSVEFIDINTVRIHKWNPYVEGMTKDFVVTNVGEYIGGGVVAFLPRLNVITKDFNPSKKEGQNIKTIYTDFLLDTTTNSEININMIMNTSVYGNMEIGNKKIESANSKFGQITDITGSNPYTIESKDHCLLTGDKINITRVLGSTELNNKTFTITFVTTDTFTIAPTSAISAYVSGGQWTQSLQQYYTLGSQYTWHRFYAACFGQFVRLQFTYSDELMSRVITHQQGFALNAMQIYYRPGGTNIFGK